MTFLVKDDSNYINEFAFKIDSGLVNINVIVLSEVLISLNCNNISNIN